MSKRNKKFILYPDKIWKREVDNYFNEQINKVPKILLNKYYEPIKTENGESITDLYNLYLKDPCEDKITLAKILIDKRIKEIIES